jgi:hypothetical protein
MIGCCEHGKELFVALDVGNSVTAWGTLTHGASLFWGLSTKYCNQWQVTDLVMHDTMVMTLMTTYI